jgi:FdhD protein
VKSPQNEQELAGVASVDVMRFREGGISADRDEVAVEAPLEIYVNEEPLATTMRTPGNDDELALGFLFAEGILGQTADLESVSVFDAAGGGSVRVQLANTPKSPARDLGRSKRGTLTTASCGVCGRQSIDDLWSSIHPVESKAQFRAQVLAALPRALSERQLNFARTGGLHAAAIARVDGSLLIVREDVGRHNAVDKLMGRLFLDQALPATDTVLVVSGRTSFEIVQKAAAAGVAALVSVSAPSSLAIVAAERAKLLLIGFARDGGFNVYAGHERLRGAESG